MPSDPGCSAEFVAAHNKSRDQHSVPRLTWSPSLAQEAQAYANHCNPQSSALDHGQGESLAKGSPNRLTRPAQVVDDFADEHNWYDYNSATSRIPNKLIGHFTQLVWEETRGVGCVFRQDCPEKVQTQ
ncbi:CAP domain-containing protein [Pyronema omphalodes]|nr:CAP domain-containing protein [Pyronema omphalodes]KAI5813961.1 CAP domain-containing protein [Pyronema omphalodes]